MKDMVIADCLICIVVLIFSLVALHPSRKATKETEIKTALTYLFIVSLLVIPLLMYQCQAK